MVNRRTNLEKHGNGEPQTMLDNLRKMVRQPVLIMTVLLIAIVTALVAPRFGAIGVMVGTVAGVWIGLRLFRSD